MNSTIEQEKIWIFPELKQVFRDTVLWMFLRAERVKKDEYQKEWKEKLRKKGRTEG